MTDDPKDRDAAAEILERWIKFRESQFCLGSFSRPPLAVAAQALLSSDFKLTNPTR
jgi:hypothetical protein